jgi:hypothetical protein
VSRNGLLVDTGYLRDHVSKLNDEKHRAIKLYNNLIALKQYCDPTIDDRCDIIIRDAKQLIEYFSTMSSVLRRVEDEADWISHKMGVTIEEDTYHTYHSSKNFML